MRAGQVTHTGLLLFGQAEVIAAHCPQAQVHYVHQTSDTAAARNDQWRVGLLLALERIEQTFSGPANPEEELSVGLFKLRVPAFPLDSVREAVLNGLTHRDYADPGEVLIRNAKPLPFTSGIQFCPTRRFTPTDHSPMLSTIRLKSASRP
jgi:ATP-dependent DNA helicase RecG